MDGKLAEFATVTGCADADKARFFLESAAGDVAAAVEAFFEHGEGEGAPGSEDPAPGSGAPEGPGAAPVAAAEHAWPAARAAALGELTPGAQLTDVLEQEVLEKGKNRAVVRQKARWRVGPASGVASVTVRACVDDKKQTACFELVNGSCDADASSFVTERTSDAKENAPHLAAYGGVLGCEVGGRNTRVYLRGVAIVAPNASGIARGVATRFAARVLRKQTRRSIADIAAIAEARARSRDDASAYVDK